MSLLVERIPTLHDNYTYLAICSETREAAVIDAAEAEPVRQRIEQCEVTLTRILSTHHHADHCMGNTDLARHFGVEVIGHHSDRNRLTAFTKGVDEGDLVSIGNLQASVLHIPAHTTGHIAFFFPEDHAIFCGDTLFAYGCGRLFEGSAEDLHAALQEKINRLPAETRIYCGHEYTESNLVFALYLDSENEAIQAELARVRTLRARAASDWHQAGTEEMTVPTTLAQERKLNPFLRAPDAETLGKIRSEKDHF